MFIDMVSNNSKPVLDQFPRADQPEDQSEHYGPGKRPRRAVSPGSAFPAVWPSHRLAFPSSLARCSPEKGYQIGNREWINGAI
jgi:hypothetical protein